LLKLEQVDNTITQAEAEYASAEIDLMVRSTTAYFGILSAEDNLLVAKAERIATEQQLEQAQQRLNIGLITITDVHETQAAFDAARASEIVSANNLNKALEALLQIVGPRKKMKLAKLVVGLVLLPPVPKNLQGWSTAAQQQNYDIIAFRAKLKVLEQEVDISKSAHYPTLDLVGTYNVKRNDSIQTNEINTDSIGLSINIPIYSGGEVNAITRQSQANFFAAQQQLDQTRRTVNRQVRDAYRDVLSTISQIDALKAATISAESALESTKTGYKVGTRTIVDVLNMQRNLFSSQRDYFNSRYNYILNVLTLKTAAGTLSEKDLHHINAWLEK
jgi:outer membrane protein